MSEATVETKKWLALLARIETIDSDIVAQEDVALPANSFERPVGNDNAPKTYLEVRDLPNQNERQTIGGISRYMGILQLDICIPLTLQYSHVAMVQLAGLVAAHFPADLVMRYEDLAVRVERAPDVGRGATDVGYWRIPISVRYTFFA